jgi:hypothetical protein
MNTFAQTRQYLCTPRRQPDFVLCVLFIERLENPTPLDSLRRAESESVSHHYLRWVLLANSRRNAWTNQRRGEKAPISSSTGANPTRQQADSLSHATPQAQTRSDSILKNEVETQSLPYSAKITIRHEEAESKAHAG